jgi:DNA helicase-2/ATP-dependent DNA helicase PcrA
MIGKIARDLMNPVRHELGFSKAESRFPMKGTCLAIYSRCINTELPIEDVLGASFPWCLPWSVELKELFASYVDAKQRQNVLDYDDLLLYWAQMMSVPALAEEVGVLFDHILVDEYQDTNRLQATILLGLKPSGRGLTSLATTLSQSTHFAQRRYATSSTFPVCSARQPRLSRSIRTIVRPNPFWRRQML